MAEGQSGKDNRMSKYINADKLIEYFRDTVINETDDAIATIRDYLAMSSADVVEVVRCKKCKYFEKGEFIDEDKSVLGFCNFHEEPWWDTDFCSYGERKENNG